ncbi:hypothetical protein H2248_011478 [Termitomyces sp. 'cryptogamus']|nr:hypothetical protein H2248_011478 [Termitomyces sp. 'cryptogamus']
MSNVSYKGYLDTTAVGPVSPSAADSVILRSIGIADKRCPFVLFLSLLISCPSFPGHPHLYNLPLRARVSPHLCPAMRSCTGLDLIHVVYVIRAYWDQTP